MVTIEQVRALAMTLPRTTEALVRDRVKFRVGRIVYLAFSRDETRMGFAFPKEEREALVRSEPEKFLMPRASDLRYHWVVVRLDAIDETEMREIVLDAWRMVVPKRVAAEFEGQDDLGPPRGGQGEVVEVSSDPLPRVAPSYMRPFADGPEPPNFAAQRSRGCKHPMEGWS